MGFSGIDDFVSEVSGGKFLRADFMKNTGGIGTVVAGRWYDLSQLPYTGTTPNYIHGNMVYNADFLAGSAGWTLGSANWAWTAGTHLLTRTANADASTVTQNTACVNGVSYSVVFTLTRSAGSITVSLGGTNGTARSSSATFRETIVCGATANAPLTFTPDATFAGTLDVVAVTRDLGFTPYTDAGTVTGKDLNLIYHGGNVSSDTKHIVNMGAWTNLAASAPATLYLVDLLGCYPRIATNSSSVQSLNNTLTLPRYTSGAGVRAFMSLNTANGANAQNSTISYTNTAPTSGRGLGTTVSNTASAITSHIFHSGAATGNTGPFLPLAGGDLGVKSVESVQFSAASASAGFVDLVLCKPLAAIPLTAAFYTNERDFLNQIPSLPKVEDGACLGLMVGCGAVMAASVYMGYIDFAWG